MTGLVIEGDKGKGEEAEDKKRWKRRKTKKGVERVLPFSRGGEEGGILHGQGKEAAQDGSIAPGGGGGGGGMERELQRREGGRREIRGGKGERGGGGGGRSLTVGKLRVWVSQLIKEGVAHGRDGVCPQAGGVLQQLGHLWGEGRKGQHQGRHGARAQGFMTK